MSVLLMLTMIAAPIVTTPLSGEDAADGRCIVVLGYAGAHGSADQAEASRRMIPYFVGRLNGRDGRPDLPHVILRAADEAKAGNVSAQAEGARCQAEFTAGTSGLLGVRAAAGLPAHAPAP